MEVSLKRLLQNKIRLSERKSTILKISFESPLFDRFLVILLMLLGNDFYGKCTMVIWLIYEGWALFQLFYFDKAKVLL